MADKRAVKIGKKIRESMKIQNISVKELTRLTSIEQQTLYSILNGHHQASIDKLELISKALQLSIDSILDIEVNTFPLYAEPHEATRTYAEFEELWLGENGGERISVSRNLSIINQSADLRKEFLEKIFEMPKDQLKPALNSFVERKNMLEQKEKSRIEIVVQSEILDFIYQREPFNLLTNKLIFNCIEGIIEKLENNPLSFELILIPRQHFLVNYEIIKREVILFDLGSVFFRQTHPQLLQHFIKEVETLKFNKALISDRNKVTNFLKGHLNAAKQGITLTKTG